MLTQSQVRALRCRHSGSVGLALRCLTILVGLPLPSLAQVGPHVNECLPTDLPGLNFVCLGPLVRAYDPSCHCCLCVPLRVHSECAVGRLMLMLMLHAFHIEALVYE